MEFHSLDGNLESLYSLYTHFPLPQTGEWPKGLLKTAVKAPNSSINKKQRLWNHGNSFMSFLVASCLRENVSVHLVQTQPLAQSRLVSVHKCVPTNMLTALVQKQSWSSKLFLFWKNGLQFVYNENHVVAAFGTREAFFQATGPRFGLSENNIARNKTVLYGQKGSKKKINKKDLNK